MSLSFLKPHQALQPGCDMWVVGLPSQSSWALRVDWFMHFQLTRACLREEATGLSFLVVAEDYLPCKWVLSIESFDSEKLLKQFEGLKVQKARLFLENLNFQNAPLRASIEKWNSKIPQFVECIEEPYHASFRR